MRALSVALLLFGCSGPAPAADPPPAATEGHDRPSTPVQGPPATAVDTVCGTRGAAPCPSGTFCDFDPGSQCGANDGGGHCTTIPEVCTREYMPVCGCDGQTHPTACVAHSAGVSVAHDGPC